MGSLEDVLAHVTGLAAKRDAQLAEARTRVRVFLLGPGFPPPELDRRRRLKERLTNRGIEAILMEDIPQWQSTLSEKFRGIIEEMRPDVLIAIFTRHGSPLGVTFEIGYLTATFGSEGLAKRLRYCLETALDATKVMTAYVQEQVPMTSAAFFRDDEGLLRAVVNFVDNYNVGSGSS